MVALAPFATSYATGGMVCSVDHLASSAGVAMLRAGGNAVDAAIATSAVLAVTTQHMCGMGGDLFALVHAPGMAEPVVLNSSGRAGSGASAERLRAEGLTAIPRLQHVAAVPVPGCVDGWCALHERFATLELDVVLEPARRLAADGFPVSPTLAGSAARALPAVAGDAAGDYPSGPDLFPGAVMRRPGVARTLEAIGRGGRAAFYEGEFGAGLLALGDGEYEPSDLVRVQADWVDGLSVEVAGWSRRIWTVPPNSQGYLTLAGAWMADALGPLLPDDPADPRWAHLLVEVARAVAHDRPDVLWEGASGPALLDPARLGPRLAAVSVDSATTSLAAPTAGGGTIYLCTADGAGMGVSLIQSNYAGFGSLLVEPSTRIFLQNRGAGFSLEAGHPAEYGPGRRPPHTLAPALVTSTDGRTLDCVLGTMGGDSQPQVLLQLLVRRFVAGQDPAASVAAARWVLAAAEVGFDVWRGGRGEVQVAVESHAPAAWFDGLAARGQAVVRSPSWGGDFGHAHLISFESSGALAGAADPRSLGGVALGL
ncbi:MAG TPA: gamma-glutamyltransferase [Acidimicrobiales bacterium]|nr:gamma-glutamyltransferase [Acidimicrobiales bacterium]